MGEAIWLSGFLLANLWLSGPELPAPVSTERTPILPALKPGAPLPPLEPPSLRRVLGALPARPQFEIRYDDIEIVTEKLVDRVDPPRFFPLIGPAQLRHCHWKCTVHFTETATVGNLFPYPLESRRTEVVYTDTDCLHLCQPTQPTPAEPSPRGVMGLLRRLGIPVNVYSSDPAERMERVLIDSENLRQVRDEYERFWMGTPPSRINDERSAEQLLRDGERLREQGRGLPPLPDLTPSSVPPPTVLAPPTHEPAAREQRLIDCENLRQMHDEWRRGGWLAQATQLTPYRIHGGVGPTSSTLHGEDVTGGTAPGAGAGVLEKLLREAGLFREQEHTQPAPLPDLTRPTSPPLATETHRTVPTFRIAPPDILQIETGPLLSKKTREPVAGVQNIRGEHLVRPDGTISLGTYGSVHVQGMSLQQAGKVIDDYLSQWLLDPHVTVEVKAYVPRKIYLIVDGGQQGLQIRVVHARGDETVLDLAAKALPAQIDKIWVDRPTEAGKSVNLPVDWTGLTRHGRTETNYQLQPGDRLHVKLRGAETPSLIQASAVQKSAETRRPNQMSLAEIVRLKEIGAPDDSILELIGATRSVFRLSGDDVTFLRRHGVSEALIHRLR